MNTVTKFGTLALSALLLVGAAGCSASTSGPQSAPAASAPAQPTAAQAATTIEAFVAATTTDKVAGAFPDKADKSTFADAVKLVDPAAPAAKTAAALADFALARVSAPKAKVTVSIDASKVVVAGQSASIPVSAVVVKADGKPVANSAALAAHVKDLVVSNGAWVIAFPKAPAAASASPSAVVATTAPAAKK